MVEIVRSGFRTGGVEPSILEVSAHGHRVLLGLRRRHPDGEVIDGYSVVSLRAERVIRIQSYESRALALEAAGQS